MKIAPFLMPTGIAAAMPAANIDTDVIMPKQFLKGIDRSGLKEGLFHDLRFDAKGDVNPDFVLNQTPWTNARFLVVGPNFGCGSSREHAVWGLKQFGIEALIGASFAGIFFDNCARNGLLAVEADEAMVQSCMTAACDVSTCEMSVDLPNQRITSAGASSSFEIDSGLKEALMRGLDTIGVTLEGRDAIAAFEARHFSQNPWLIT